MGNTTLLCHSSNQSCQSPPLTTPILHRDITSFNFLVQDNSKLLLTDFGNAKDCVKSVYTNTTGTLQWSAPEIWDEIPKWSDKADIYSLGMVFFEIVSCEIPFETDKNIFQIGKKIQQGIRPKIPSSCPKAKSLSPPLT
jgi:serine/threonine protein kinase